MIGAPLLALLQGVGSPGGPTVDVMAAPTLDVSWFDVAGGAGLILMAAGIARWQGTGLGRDFLVGGIRTVVQLALVGYALAWVFALNRWPLVLAVLAVMLLVAAWTAAGRQEERSPRLLGVMTLALLSGSGLTLVYVSGVVVRVDPWYNPRYLIPLFGMIIGNAMNAAALAAERLHGEMETRRGEVEAYLALGADPARAAREPLRRALRASLIPTINGLMVVGIVSLPGMMTGQILAGSDPLLAVRYQVVVMFMLASAVALSAFLVLRWMRDEYFTPAQQLRPPREPVGR